MWASKEGGSGPGDKQHGGERGHSCLFLEDPPSLPFLFLGPVLWIEYILLLSSPFKATSNCSLVLALCSIHDFISMLGGSLAKALLLLEMRLIFLSDKLLGANYKDVGRL